MLHDSWFESISFSIEKTRKVNMKVCIVRTICWTYIPATTKSPHRGILQPT